MDINRAGKQTKAFWRAEMKQRSKWMNEPLVTDFDKRYGNYQITQQRTRGFAAGWIAGIAWSKRQKKP